MSARAPAQERGRTSVHRDERGVALLAALAVMSLTALLVVGGVAASTLAQRAARQSHTDARLMAAADYALSTVLADAEANGLADLPFGIGRSYTVPEPDAAVTATVSVTRLRRGTLWLVATAALAGLDTGQRRINLVLRFAAPSPAPVAAIMARGSVALAADVVFPADTATDPDCAGASSADVAIPSSAQLTGSSAARLSHPSAASDSSTYLLKTAQRAALATSPHAVHVAGDTVIAGGHLDGILMVDGSLTITGPFAATGLIVAGGPIRARAGGLVVDGALLSAAQPADGSPAVDLSGASIRFGACAVSRGFRMSVSPRPVRQRSWAELF